MDSSDDAAASQASLSPSLSVAAPWAYEQKFLVAADVARAIERWAGAAMRTDPHADQAANGAYELSTLYLDTPGFDVFHGAQHFRGAKHRIRRYGREALVYLERKTRRGDRVKKRRSGLPRDELAKIPAPRATGTGDLTWFVDALRLHELRPVCAMTYRRTAFFGEGDHGPYRLTLDRAVRGLPARDFAVEPIEHGIAVLSDAVVCELKFAAALPQPFKQLVAELALAPTSVSKYRRLCVAAGLVAGLDAPSAAGGPDAADARTRSDA